MPIVTGNKRTNVVLKAPPGKSEPGWTARKYRIGSRGAQFLIYGGKTILAVEDDINAIRKHFNCNRTDAFKLALRLTAEAIRRGRLSL